jgi:hypothetical protein
MPMDALDRQEFDRLYDRLIARFAGPARPGPASDTLSLAALQRLMDRVQAEDIDKRDTDPMPESCVPEAPHG